MKRNVTNSFCFTNTTIRAVDICPEHKAVIRPCRLAAEKQHREIFDRTAPLFSHRAPRYLLMPGRKSLITRVIETTCCAEIVMKQWETDKGHADISSRTAQSPGSVLWGVKVIDEQLPHNGAEKGAEYSSPAGMADLPMIPFVDKGNKKCTKQSTAVSLGGCR